MLLLAAGCLGLTMCQHVDRAVERQGADRAEAPPATSGHPRAPAAPPTAAPASSDATAVATERDKLPAAAANASAPTNTAPKANTAPKLRRVDRQPAAKAPNQAAAPQRRELPFAATKAPPGLY